MRCNSNGALEQFFFIFYFFISFFRLNSVHRAVLCFKFNALRECTHKKLIIHRATHTHTNETTAHSTRKLIFEPVYILLLFLLLIHAISEELLQSFSSSSSSLCSASCAILTSKIATAFLGGLFLALSLLFFFKFRIRKWSCVCVSGRCTRARWKVKMQKNLYVYVLSSICYHSGS